MATDDDNDDDDADDDDDDHDDGNDNGNGTDTGNGDGDCNGGGHVDGGCDDYAYDDATSNAPGLATDRCRHKPMHIKECLQKTCQFDNAGGNLPFHCLIVLAFNRIGKINIGIVCIFLDGWRFIDQGMECVVIQSSPEIGGHCSRSLC